MSRHRTNLDRDLNKGFAARQRRLRAIARRAGNQEEEDVIQEAYLKVVETSHQEEVRQVDQFLSRLVRYTSIDWFRRRTRRATVTAGKDSENLVDVTADPERAVIGAQRLERVMAAIETMPPRRREVFLLHRIEELTYPQIAKRLGISVKAVEKHVHLAMLGLSNADD